MRIVVLGAGSWGTTVASLVVGRHPTVLWARKPEVADEINEQHTNSTYLAGCALPPKLTATDDIEKAVAQAELLIVGVPSHGFRETLLAAKTTIHPWIPVVSLTKGLERDSLLRMTEVIKDVLPGHPAAALTGPNIAREIMGGQAAASVIATEDLAGRRRAPAHPPAWAAADLHEPRRHRLRARRCTEERRRPGLRHGSGSVGGGQHARRGDDARAG